MLSDGVETLKFVGQSYASKLEKLGIVTREDFLLHIPHRYLDFSLISKINRVQIGETVTIRGEIVEARNLYTRRGMKIQLIKVEDATGQMAVVFFNQPFLVNTLAMGSTFSFAGKVDWWAREKALIGPEFERVGESLHTGRLIPIYPETAGVSSKWLRRVVKIAFSEEEKNLQGLIEGYREAVGQVHFPKSAGEATAGRKRLALNELVALQMASLERRKTWEARKTFKVEVGEHRGEVAEFMRRLPFELTGGQSQVIAEVLADLENGFPMNRLLEGDVGSGKTVVAAVGLFVVFLNGYKSVFMAPTQILANQHFETLKRLFEKYQMRVALLTAGSTRKGAGAPDVYVGTHALIHRKVDLARVALVVIDEQHKFGVEQRAHFLKRSRVPHTLSLTATPIPRSVALTLYGEMDLSALTELPAGRQKVVTWVVPEAKEEKAWGWIKKEVRAKKTQAFVVCPLIEESETETLKEIRAVKGEYEKLRKTFRGLKVDLLHGRMKAGEKERVIEAFRQGKTDILVTTPVVEVGVDISNATIMAIEGAERFGLASLHQLRGRVGRSQKKSYCLLFGKETPRLTAMKRMHSGFELAEVDLKLRGPGEMSGRDQHGFGSLKIASWQDTELIKEARRVAETLVKR